MKLNFRALGVALILAGTTGAYAGTTGATQAQPILPTTVSAFWESVSLPGQIGPPIRGDASSFSTSNGSFASNTWYGNGWISNLDGWEGQTLVGFWVDISGGQLTQVTAPDSFTGLTLKVKGQVVDSNFGDGSTYSFASGIQSFQVIGLPATFKAGTGVDSSVLPLQLSFSWASGSVPSLVWRTISVVPEADTWLMLSVGLLVLGLSRSRSRAT